MPRFACRRDENEKIIFDALRVAGAEPKRFTDFDIGARHSSGVGVMLEIKTAKGKLREKQEWLADMFGDRYFVVRTAEQALIACGRMT
jgi:predicted mannosyl-3-phosphoglycerate phosphatase (HAD superfamily)